MEDKAGRMGEWVTVRKRKQIQYQQVLRGSEGGSTVGNYRGGTSGKKKGTNLKGVRAELPTFVCTFPIYS